MNLEFEVNEKILRQKKPHHHQGDIDNLFCSFVFTSREWKHIEKYAVFWNRKGKSTIRFLGKGLKERCPLPKMVLNDSFFYVQVYANDDILTQKMKIYTKKHISHDENNECNKKMLNKFFEEMENKIDNIVYDDNKLLIYVDDTLVKTIDIVDDSLVYKILQGSTQDFITDKTLSPDSDLPIANKAVYDALLQKADIASLANVAFTGDYNDLKNIPEFNHTHTAEEITNLENYIDENIDNLIDKLTNEL